MPEGDSLFKYAARLRPVLQGQVVRAARAQGPGAVPKVEQLVGATCTGVRAVGKNLIITFDHGLALRGHLRMYGSWHVYAPGEAWRKPHPEARLVLEVPGATVVNFSAPVIELLSADALVHHRPVAGLGPDLLAADFDVDAVLAAFRDPALAELTIGDALMEQRLMAGVGNIWKHETLFRCRLNPWLSVGELDDEALRAVVTTARDLLRRAAGIDGRGRPTYYVYKRTGFACMRCGSRIRADRQGRDHRYTSWCPACQPLDAGQAVQPAGKGAPVRRPPAR